MFYLGLDLGQRVDHSAIVVVQRQPGCLLVPYVERVMLGTPYPRLVSRVHSIVNQPPLAGACSVAVDATGVGGPIVEMLRAARLGCELLSVTITGGERTSVQSGLSGIHWSVPKLELMAGVQALLEKGELKIAKDLKETGSLMKELLDIRSLSSRSGRLRLGAEAPGEHDDLVTALALACWSARRQRNGVGHTRIL